MPSQIIHRTFLSVYRPYGSSLQQMVAMCGEIWTCEGMMIVMERECGRGRVAWFQCNILIFSTKNQIDTLNWPDIRSVLKLWDRWPNASPNFMWIYFTRSRQNSEWIFVGLIFSLKMTWPEWTKDHPSFNFFRWSICLSCTRNKPHGVEICSFPWLCNGICTQIITLMGPTWGPLGSCRLQLGPRLAPWSLLSGAITYYIGKSCNLTELYIEMIILLMLCLALWVNISTTPTVHISTYNLYLHNYIIIHSSARDYAVPSAKHAWFCWWTQKHEWHL